MLRLADGPAYVSEFLLAPFGGVKKDSSKAIPLALARLGAEKIVGPSAVMGRGISFTSFMVVHLSVQ